jgi:hypothetical protein
VTDFQLFDQEGTILHADSFAKSAMVTKSISEEVKAIVDLYREEPHDADDSGWRASAGEGKEYLGDVENLCLVSLRELVALDYDNAIADSELKDLLQGPVGSAFSRGDDGAPLVPPATD